MRKYGVPTYDNENRNWRRVYSHCTYNMAGYELECEGLKNIECRNDGDLIYIDGEYENKKLHYVWDERKEVLYMIEGSAA